jgi:MFS family permease
MVGMPGTITIITNRSTGVCSAGSAIGAVLNAHSADRYSRKYTIQIGAILTIIGAALSGGSVNVAMFLVARFVSGLGIGILISVIPM